MQVGTVATISERRLLQRRRYLKFRKRLQIPHIWLPDLSAKGLDARSTTHRPHVEVTWRGYTMRLNGVLLAHGEGLEMGMP